jgi:hypothetical protein
LFVSVRKYRLRRGSTTKWTDRVHTGFLPILQAMPGFRGYHLLDGGPDELIAITLFNHRDQAFASNERAADWVRDNVLEFVIGFPEVMGGDALISETRNEG